MPLYRPDSQEAAALEKLDSGYAYTAVHGGQYECALVSNYKKLPWIVGRGSSHEEAMKDAIAKGLAAGKPMTEAQRLASENSSKDDRIKELEARLLALEAKKSKKGKTKPIEPDPEDEDQTSDEPDEGGDEPPPAIPSAPKAPTGAKK